MSSTNLTIATPSPAAPAGTPGDPPVADGAAGERRAAALLGIATCAQVAHATLYEDGAKVDVKLSFRSPYDRTIPLTAHCQIKTGISFKADSSTQKLLTLRNVNDALSVLSQGSQPAVLLWVPPRPSSRVYWHIIKRRRLGRGPVRIPRDHYVSPALRFDIAKASAFLLQVRQHSSFQLKKIAEDDLLRMGKRAYGKLMKEAREQRLTHPLVGRLNVTRMGWRHILRHGRGVARRRMSLRLTPYLCHLLSSTPDRYIVANEAVEERGARMHHRREIVCWYKYAAIVDGRHGTVLIRIQEDIHYPKTWHRYPFSEADVVSTATLKGWWVQVGDTPRCSL